MISGSVCWRVRVGYRKACCLRSDFGWSLRRIKPERFIKILVRHPDNALTFVGDTELVGSPLLLDTCVYIGALEGSLAPAAEVLLQARMLMHLSVVLGELSHNFGPLALYHFGAEACLAELAGVTKDIPAHRIEDAVSADVLLEAGILAGLVSRLSGFARGQELATLNDAAIYPHAQCVAMSC